MGAISNSIFSTQKKCQKTIPKCKLNLRNISLSADGCVHFAEGGGWEEEDTRRHLNVIRSAVPPSSPPETISFPRHGMNSIFPADPFHPPFPAPSSFSVTVNNFFLYRKENPRDR
ncbi:hypothetical protein CEXT_365391 [Caerostris extrusa]|uniref:Uncharacterized protein n=1 Tax=Caerostris extrusa TaxID=172846 RepID=A0AAV4PWQ8_CAEEX|nr:hypothetical protein CEXT_365391 [Caerostris extrusa]